MVWWSRMAVGLLVTVLGATSQGQTAEPGAASSDAEDQHPTGIVQGKVSSVSEQTIADIELRLEPHLGKVTVGPDGSYEITGLLPGRYVLTVEAPGYEPQREELTVHADDGLHRIDVQLKPAYRALGEITVSSSFTLNTTDPAPGVALDRQELLELPHPGDDVIRALPLLPGVTAGDTSGKFNVRGALFREVLFQLDGLEIYEPYHLPDYEGVFSIIDPRLLADVQLFPGGFTAEHGDRSAAVLDLTTIRPRGKAVGELGLSFMTIWGNGQGGFAGDRGTWFGSVRRGFLDLILDMVGPEDSETERSEGNGPAYWDINGKLGYEVAPTHQVTARLLWSIDTVDAEEWEVEDGYPEHEYWDTSYGNSSLWIEDSLVLGDQTFVSSVLSSNTVDRDRVAAGEDYNGTSSIRDERDLTVLGLRQDWSLQASRAHYLKFGLDVRQYDVHLDYENQYTHAGGEPEGRAFVGDSTSASYGIYGADRFRLSRHLTAELGVRWDRNELTDDDRWSPRVNLVWALTPATVLRSGWGHYYQSQRPHELQVEDGETEYHHAERAEHRTFGFEHWWQTDAGHWSIRAEVYQRLMTDLRPRYENLFNVFQLYPETSYDRYRIAPDSAEARGAELLLARRGAGRLDWWVSYAWSEVTDEVEGRDVPRQFDQTHAVTLSAIWRPGSRWTVAGTWIYHTGWPTTAVSGELVASPSGEPEIVPILGPVHDERLPAYHRLDLRLTRRFELGRRGTLETFFEVQNAYDRLNVSGYTVDDRAFSITADGDVIYSPRPEEWLGVVPSIGICWRF
jgi:outer membrane receptor protein involved in Fe transport